MRAIAGEGNACEHCGGLHTSRQRCPAAAAAVNPDGAPAPDLRVPAAAAQARMPRPSLSVAAVPPPTAAIVGGRARRARRPGTSPAFVAWSASIVGAVSLISAITAAGGAAWSLTQASTDATTAIVTIAVAIGVGIVVGIVPLWFAARTIAKFALAAVALVLVTGGLALMTAAPVVWEMETAELAERRGFWSLTVFGLAATVAGLALAAQCVRWSMRERARAVLSRWSRVLGAAYGVWLALVGLNTLFAFLSLIGSESSVDETGVEWSVVHQSIAITVIAGLTFVPGILLVYHGISASMGESSSPFRPPLAAAGLLAFGVVMLTGEANMMLDDPIAAPMPPLHLLAAMLPGVTLTAVAARGSFGRGKPVLGLTWRQVLLSAAISMTVGVAIAVYVESFGGLYAIILLLANNGAFEFADSFDEVMEIIGDATIYLSEEEQFVAGLITAAVLAPVSEEFGKSLGVRFMMRPHTTRAQCFVLGAFAGAGFGFLEALMYGLAGIEDELGFWWAIMTVRGASTTLHVICTGLAGVGWWYWSRAKQHRTALALFGTAMLIHALWNAFATLIYSRIFFFETLSSRLLDIIAFSVVGVVSAAMAVAIPLVAQRLRERIPPVRQTPLARMQPWMG